MKLLITIAFLLSGCCGEATLAEKISLSLVQTKAKVNGKYCYQTDNGDKFCVSHVK